MRTKVPGPDAGTGGKRAGPTRSSGARRFPWPAAPSALPTAAVKESPRRAAWRRRKAAFSRKVG